MRTSRPAKLHSNFAGVILTERPSGCRNRDYSNRSRLQLLIQAEKTGSMAKKKMMVKATLLFNTLSCDINKAIRNPTLPNSLRKQFLYKNRQNLPPFCDKFHRLAREPKVVEQV
jgi:hypothetical protein